MREERASVSEGSEKTMTEAERVRKWMQVAGRAGVYRRGGFISWWKRLLGFSGAFMRSVEP